MRGNAWAQSREAHLRCVESQQRWMYKAMILSGRLASMGIDVREVIDCEDKEILREWLKQCWQVPKETP